MLLLTGSLLPCHPCTVHTEGGAFIQSLFSLLWKLLLCFLAQSPNHRVFSMLAKSPNFYSCKSVCKILKQPNLWHINFNLPPETTHPLACCILLFFIRSIVLSSPTATFPLETHSFAHWGRNYSIYASHIFVKITNDVTNHAVRYEGAATAWWSEEKHSETLIFTVRSSSNNSRLLIC